MNKLFLLTALVALFAFAACDDDDSSNNTNNVNNVNNVSNYTPSEVCQRYCDKDDECDLGDFATITECMDMCVPTAENMLQDFGNALYACYDTTTCTDLLADDTCYDDSAAVCTTDYEPTVEVMCAVMFECENGTAPTQTELDACTTAVLAQSDVDMYACFTEEALGNFETCIEDGTCSDTLIDDCMASELGVDTSDDTTAK